MEGIAGERSQFSALYEADEREEVSAGAAGPQDDDAEKAKKAAKKEAKRLERERREAELAKEQAKKATAAQVVLVKVDGKEVPDTQVAPDLDAIQAKYEGRRKRPVVEVEA